MQKDLHRRLRDPNLLPSETQTLLSQIADQAASMGMPCYVVGGFVRDLLLNEPLNDLDIIVEGDAIKLGNALIQKYGGQLTPHTKFCTAIWHVPETWNLMPDTLDLITARSETYEHAAALPTIKPSSIKDDLGRRDFTINAMAVRLDGEYFGELLDPLGGQKDLAQKLIRVLHPLSFIDDPTRILRAIRYEQRYGFKIDSPIEQDALDAIQKLSGERIRHELDLILHEKNSLQMILRAGKMGIFKWIHPKLPGFNQAYAELLDTEPILDIPMNRISMGYMLWLIDLPEDIILSIARRLDFTTDLTHMVWAASLLKITLTFLANSKPSEWAFALERLPLPAIYIVYLITRENALLDYLSIWRHIKPHITGEDLKARGLPPGPRYKEILSNLRAAWLDGEIHSSNDELHLLETYLKSVRF